MCPPAAPVAANVDIPLLRGKVGAAVPGAASHVQWEGAASCDSVTRDKLNLLEDGLASQFAACDENEIRLNELQATMCSMRKDFDGLSKDLEKVVESVACLRPLEVAGSFAQVPLSSTLGPQLEPQTEDRVEVLEQEVAAWTGNVEALLTNQTQTFLGALSGLNEKLLDRVRTLESDIESLRRADSSVIDRICYLEMLGATSLPTGVDSRKLCRYHPGCKHGSSCKFAHDGGLSFS